MPSPLLSLKLLGYTWYTIASFHHFLLGISSYFIAKNNFYIKVTKTLPADARVKWPCRNSCLVRTPVQFNCLSSKNILQLFSLLLFLQYFFNQNSMKKIPL